MKRYEEFISSRYAESETSGSPDKEIKVSRSIGSPVGNRMDTTSAIISKLQPVVSTLVRDMQRQGMPMRDIEEALEDGLRQVILSVGDEGKKIDSPHTTMSTSTFLKKARERRGKLEPQGDPSVFGQLPDSLEKWQDIGRKKGKPDF